MKKEYLSTKGIIYSKNDQTKNETFRVRIERRVDNKRQRASKVFNVNDYSSIDAAFKAALAHRNELIEHFDINSTIIIKDPTISELFTEKNELLPKSYMTIKKHISMYNCYIKPFFENTTIRKIKPYEIQQSLNAMAMTATNDTIQRVLSLWRDLIKTAIMKDYLNYDLTLKIIVPTSKFVKQKKSVEVSTETILNMIDALESTVGLAKDVFNCKLYSYLILLIYYTGMRPSECYALNRKDIKPDYIVINKRIGSTYTEPIAIVPTKTEQSTRNVPIPKALHPVFEDLFSFQPSEWLFADYYGNFLNTHLVSDKIARAAKSIEVEFNLYMLRHKLVTDLLETQNVGDRTVMDILGHSNYAMTVSYARSDKEKKKKALEQRKLN